MIRRSITVAAAATVATTFVWLQGGAAPAPPSVPTSVTVGVPDLQNPTPYLPAQCYAVTQEKGRTHNGCFACHQASLAPNFVDDGDVQTELSLPRLATVTPWTNLLHPPAPAAISERELLAWVRTSNYLGADRGLRLAQRLAAPPPAWDADHNGKWDGFIPDCQFNADENGWDHDRDGRATGWRAYAYRPVPGLFWPTNGSAGDAFIRLPEAYRRDATGQDSREIYAVNLAIVEAYLRRVDVAIPPTDEQALGSDLDGDGVLGPAGKVAFIWPPVAGRPFGYVGQAATLERARAGFPAAGLFPTGTEIVHSLRYLDVAQGTVRMAARMKELRYMRKDRWLTYSDLDLRAKAEMREKDRQPDRLKRVMGDAERGVGTGTGWRMAGFIEDAGGELRPQTLEETGACIGCHGGIGTTADSTFSFARKVPGWHHWNQRGLAGIAELRRTDGRGEYQVWLEQVGGGDDFRSNQELLHKVFDGEGRVRPEVARRWAKDISLLVVPSPGRAMALDRAYLGIVRDQSFVKGRDVVLGTPRANERVEKDAPTGIEEAFR